ncbi:subclass B1 metallo-beta-lactamase [Saccharicrinis sp. FJH54]|uniref:subclass B1 metallo-beta-lactamase n=1 Tax=Saccharicrinis sp. FJH54 TaxID=3344665 RepID=UPI0035D51153
MRSIFLLGCFLAYSLFFNAQSVPVLNDANGFSDKTIKISDDVSLIRISDDAYIHVSFSKVEGYGRVGANGLVLTDKGKAFLFDSPWNDAQTEILLNYLKDSLHLKVVGFVPNHWHEDCMGGLQYIQDQHILSYANEQTREICHEKGLPVPLFGFRDSLFLEFGSKTIKCFYLGAAHSLDNIVVWIPSEQILFPGCIVKSLNSRNLGNTADGDLNAYPETIRKLQKQFSEAKIVIPGHGQYGGMELIKHTLELANEKME